MDEQTDQDRHIEAIEEMPAAPEADPGTRDADAPTWSAPTEGHTELPLSAPSTDADPLSADAAAATPGAAPAAATPGAVPELISADRVDVNQGGAQRIEGREVNVTQGGAAIIRGDKVNVEQGGAAIIVGRRITLRDSGAFILLARRVDGEVNVALDWRALAAIFAGILAILVVRGRR